MRYHPCMGTVAWYGWEAVVQKCSVEKVFLEISQSSQENTCARISFLIKLRKKSLWHICFPVNFAKFLRTPFLTEQLWWLLPKILSLKLKDVLKMFYEDTQDHLGKMSFRRLKNVGYANLEDILRNCLKTSHRHV